MLPVYFRSEVLPSDEVLNMLNKIILIIKKSIRHVGTKSEGFQAQQHTVNNHKKDSLVRGFNGKNVRGCGW
jgi:hypothetical protein